MSNPAERRTSPRVEVLGKMRGQVVSMDVPVAVREISLGGMSIETQQGFQVGSVQDFYLTLGDGSGVELMGRIVYSRLTTDATRNFYVSGIQFVDGHDEQPDHPVDGLIRRVS